MSSSVALVLTNGLPETETISGGSGASNWTSYTPTFTGLGTVSTQSFWYKIDGDSIYIKGSFICGIPTATQAQISLPSGYTSQASKISSPLEICAFMGFNSSVAYTPSVLIEPGVTYLTFSFTSATGGSLTEQNGNALFSASGTYAFSTTAIPIS